MEFSSMFFMIRLVFAVLVMGAQSLGACAQPTDDILSIQRLPVRSKQAAKAMTEKIVPLVMKYAEGNSLVASDYPYETYRKSAHYRVRFGAYFEDFDLTNTKFQNAETLYDIIFDGRPYIAGVGSYVPVLKAVPSCVPSEAGSTVGHCEGLAENNQVCHLFLFDVQTHVIIAVGANRA
jgi:hypothetical protein